MKLTSFLMLTLLIISCGSESKVDFSNDIVIIVDKPFAQNYYVTPSGVVLENNRAGMLSYIRDGELVNYTPQSFPDTLVLKHTQEFVEISFPYLNVEDWYFLIQRGDIVSFTFNESNIPYLISRTSENLTRLYNFHLTIKDREAHLGFEPLTFLLNHGHYFRKLAQAPKLAPSIYEKYKADYISIDSLKKSFLAYSSSYRKMLDSMRSKENVSIEFVQYYSYLLQLKEWEYYISSYYFEDNILLDTTIDNFFSDSYLEYLSYDSYIGSYLSCFYPKSRSIPSVRFSNGEDVDWRRCFDSVEAESIFPPKTKNRLLAFCLNNIVNAFSGNDLNIYLDRYIAATGDTIAVNKLKVSNNLDFTKSEELVLQDLNGKQITLKQILEKHKGKVIYIDFWASWCAPCKYSMPYAKQLREEYRNRNIVFIYLAYNDEQEAWKNAVEKYEVSYLAENYLILNPKTSKFIVDYNIKTIPRYMLYSKNGELVDKDVPRPEANNIRELIDECLLR